MTPTDRWLFIGALLTWTTVVIVTGYLLGVRSCGVSFGFY